MTLPRATLAVLALPSLCLLLAAGPAGTRVTARKPRAVPGRASADRVRLPNGWYLSPTGRQIDVGDFPLGMAVSPDGALLAIVHGGWHGKGLDLLDLRAGRNVQHIVLEDSWLGVAFVEGGKRLAVAAGHTNRVLLFPVDASDGGAGRLGTPDSVVLGPAWSGGGLYPQGQPVPPRADAIWPTGLAADDARGRLFVVSRLDSALTRIDTRGARVERRCALGAVPYTALVSRDGRSVYVSLWSSASLAVVDAESLTVRRVIAVGAHPSDLAESRDGRRVYVANANENSVSVVDVRAGRTTELLRTSRTPREPDGDTPNGLALNERGDRLYVANAGGNHVAVFDVAAPGRSQALGFLPVGWYPTAVRVQPGAGTLLVANGKGAGSAPSSVADADTLGWCQYVVYSPVARGTLSLIREPDAATLAQLTRSVLANTPALHKTRPAVRRSGISHVFYIIKENRSYDQLFGDLPQGDGDSSLCLFGERITPNHHALAREFVLLDNTYCDSDGSADGHNWGMGANATDYVTKGQISNRIYDFEGGNPLAYPREGYLWDLCQRHGISYRSYGEFVFNGATPADTVRAGVAGLVDHVAPRYQGYDLTVSDLDRYRAWLNEFDRYDSEGGLPQLSIIRLPNDHTEGTCSGRPTPRAHVAENDLALGLMVERISHSRYWPGALVLVIEDDAGNGQDHVDGHRTIALAVGPSVKRGAVDSGLYTNCSVLRCIEDVFGLPPMSQFDARANGLEGVFQRAGSARTASALRPYLHRGAQVDVNETNLAGAWGQAESDAMNFSVADVVPYDVLNRILWHSVHGADAPPPPPVRSGFALGVRRAGTADADDDD